MSTLSKNQFIRKIKSFFLQFLYGISITVPFTTSYDYKGVYGIIFFSTWSNFMIFICPLHKYGILSDNEFFLYSLFPAIIIGILIFIYYNYIVKFLDKTWAEKYYCFDINRCNDDLYSVLLEIHREYGRYSKYNKFKYITDNGIINKHKKYNMKWRFIAVIYILITIFNLYLLDKLNI